MPEVHSGKAQAVWTQPHTAFLVQVRRMGKKKVGGGHFTYDDGNISSSVKDSEHQSGQTGVYEFNALAFQNIGFKGNKDWMYIYYTESHKT